MEKKNYPPIETTLVLSEDEMINTLGGWCECKKGCAYGCKPGCMNGGKGEEMQME